MTKKTDSRYVVRCAALGCVMRIEIVAGGETFAADFAPVRRIGASSLGWATVTTDDVTLRFPAIVDAKYRRVLTVRDWQAPWGWLDLSDPHDVITLGQTGAGQFLTPSGNESSAFSAFFRAAVAEIANPNQESV